MNKDSVITKDMRRQIGVQSEPWVMEVERGMIARFAEAIDDPNPVYHDEDYAKQSSYQGIVAPPMFFGWPVSPAQSVLVPSPFFRNVTGGTEVVYDRPIRAGERLIATSRLVDLYERQGKQAGRMLFQIVETTFRDLNGKVVARQITTDITFEGAG